VQLGDCASDDSQVGTLALGAAGAQYPLPPPGIQRTVKYAQENRGVVGVAVRCAERGVGSWSCGGGGKGAQPRVAVLRLLRYSYFFVSVAPKGFSHFVGDLESAVTTAL
jgi:hypothetical protein